MRCLLLAVALLLPSAAHAAEADASPFLLKPGESPPKGWSVAIFQTESVFSGGRIKVGNSDTCSSTDTAPCHFAVPDGPASILIDQPLEYGDTTGTLAVSGQRVFVIKSIQNTGRAAARAFGGLLGAALSQPDDPPPTAGAQAAGAGESGPLVNVRKGSRFDMEFVSMSEPGKAGEFLTPQEK